MMSCIDYMYIIIYIYYMVSLDVIIDIMVDILCKYYGDCRYNSNNSSNVSIAYHYKGSLGINHVS